MTASREAGCILPSPPRLGGAARASGVKSRAIPAWEHLFLRHSCARRWRRGHLISAPGRGHKRTPARSIVWRRGHLAQRLPAPASRRRYAGSKIGRHRGHSLPMQTYYLLEKDMDSTVNASRRAWIWFDWRVLVTAGIFCAITGLSPFAIAALYAHCLQHRCRPLRACLPPHS